MQSVVKLITTEWCTYCPSVEEIMQELEQELGIDLEIVDGDANRERVYSWGVKAYPTTLICNHAGKVSRTLVGIKTKEELKEFIKG